MTVESRQLGGLGLALALLLSALAPACGSRRGPAPMPGEGEVRASAPDGTHVEVVFPAPVESFTGGDLLRYRIADFTTSSEERPLAVMDAAVDGDRVVLTTEMQQPGVTYTLRIENVEDVYGRVYTRTVNFVGVGEAPRAPVTFRVDDTFEQTLEDVRLIVTFDPRTGFFTHFHAEVPLADPEGDHVWEATFQVAVDQLRTLDTGDDRLSPIRIAYGVRAVDASGAPLSELVLFEVTSTEPKVVDIPLSSRPPPPPPEGLVDVAITVDDTRARALTKAELAASIRQDGTFDSSFPTRIPLTPDPKRPGIYTASAKVRLDPNRRIGGEGEAEAPYVFYVVNEDKPYPNLSASVDALDENPRQVTITVGNPDLVPVTFRVDVSRAYLSLDGRERGVRAGESVFLTGQFNVAETAFGENASDAFTGGESTALEMQPLPGVPGVWQRTIFLPPNRAYSWKVVRCPSGEGCSRLNQLVVSSGRAFATVMKNLATENRDAGSNPEVAIVDPRSPQQVVTPAGTLDYSSAQIYAGLGKGREPDPDGTPTAATLFKQEVPDLVVEVGTEPVLTPVYVIGTWRDVNLPETPTQLLARCGDGAGGCSPLDLNPYDYDDGFAGAQPPTYELRPPSRFNVSDGQLDPGTTIVAGTEGMTLTVRLAYDEQAQMLYLATEDAGEGSDHFLFFATDPPGTLAAAQWGKAGQVATAPAMYFMADENDGPYAGWFRRAGAGAEQELSDLDGGDPAFRIGTAAQNGGVLEGTIDLAAAFGSVPQVIYVAAAPWGSGDGGPLYGVAQAPAGNGDAHLDGAEFVKVRLPDLTVVP